MARVCIRGDRTAMELALLMKRFKGQEVFVASTDMTLEDLMVDWGFFPSLTQARKTKYSGEIPQKDYEFTFGKNKERIFIFWEAP